MTRLLFGRGSRGGIIRSIQQHLQIRSLYGGPFDGDYGSGTEHAIQALQAQESLGVTGEVDDVTWNRLMDSPLPSVFERSLQLTSTFEGHGFSKVQGNWDHAWLTWGIIGFTLKHGEVGSIVQQIDQADSTILPAVFGVESATQLLHIVTAAASEQEAWANSITQGTSVIEPWHSGFEKLGQDPRAQAIQLAHAAKDYFVPAQATAVEFNLKTELGLALCFDIHVQNGGIKADARQTIANGRTDGMSEPALRVLIANAVATAALPEFQADVRSRKLTLATGAGTVHGGTFTVGNWGLGEFPAA